MVRKQLQITEKQNNLLKERAHKEDCSQSEIVREALSKYFKIKKEEDKMFRIDFGSFDDNRNFDWKEIREIMSPFPGYAGDLADITFDSREEAEEMLEKIQPYVDSSIVKVVEE